MKDKIVVAFGRMNPPQIGHSLLVNKVVDTAAKANADHMIVLSATQDKKKNPLPVARKVFWAKKMNPGANIVAAGAQTRTIIEVAKSLSGKYKHLVVVGGSDRTEEFKTLLEKYNGKEYNFDSIEIVQAGERDPDADGAAGMSATKMRKAAVDNDVAAFKSGVGSNLKAAEIKLLMREIRVGLGMNEQETTMKTFKEYTSNLDEEIKGWKHAGSDLMKNRIKNSRENLSVQLHKLKADGKESGMHDARQQFGSEEEAQKHVDTMHSNNPGKKFSFNKYVGGKHVGVSTKTAV